MFASKVVIVTGSSSGIGAGTAIKFAKLGAAGVVLHGRKEEALKNVKEQCEKAGNGKTKVHVVVGDITQQKTREKSINETVQQFGRLDVLVNNAGLSIPSPITQTSIDVFDQLLDVNVRSTIVLTQLAIPHLVKAKGSIVNISSVASLRAMPTFVFYCMAKVALDHFTRCLAVELGPQGVRVNCINPGSIPDTDLGIRSGATAQQVKEYNEKASANYPLRRPGTVDEVANAITFLASDHASFITGLVAPVDGGSVLQA
jgi:NAD(P)-dependent dehydrogenase (short-subunit alcohol dehydrogenase family)